MSVCRLYFAPQTCARVTLTALEEAALELEDRAQAELAARGLKFSPPPVPAG